MPDKIKITKKELDELYDIVPAGDDIDFVKQVEDDDGKNATFEEFTETYDKKQEKEFREET